MGLRGALNQERLQRFPDTLRWSSVPEASGVKPMAGAFGAPLLQLVAGALAGAVERLEQILAIDAEILEASSVVVEKRLKGDALSSRSPDFGEPVHQSA